MVPDNILPDAESNKIRRKGVKYLLDIRHCVLTKWLENITMEGNVFYVCPD